MNDNTQGPFRHEWLDSLYVPVIYSATDSAGTMDGDFGARRYSEGTVRGRSTEANCEKASFRKPELEEP